MTSRDNDLSLLSHLSSPNKLLDYTRFLLSLKPLIPIRSPSFSNESDTSTILSPLTTASGVEKGGGNEKLNLKEERRPSVLIDRTNPLAVLLFLLEGLIFLRSTVTLITTSTSTAINRLDSEDEKENFEQVGEDLGTERMEKEEKVGIDWESWKSYIQEVYLYSPHNINKRASTQALWSSPLSISSSILPSLNSISQLDSNDSESQALIEQACRSAYIYLASLSDPSEESGVIVSEEEATGRIKLLLSLPSDNFPLPLAKNLQEVISTTLSSRRRIIGPTSNVYDTLSSIAPSPLTFRSVLSTILEHFFSASCFGLTKGKDGDWRYAIREEDNEFIKGFYLVPEGKSDGKGGEDSSDRAAGVRVAMLSISGRDDMAKYMSKNSMNDLESRPSSRSSSNSTPLTYPSPPPLYSSSFNNQIPGQDIPTRLKPTHNKSNSSMDSFNSSRSRPYSLGSASGLASGANGPSPHRRVYSTSTSSKTHLLSSDSDSPSAVPSEHVTFGNLTPVSDTSSPHSHRYSNNFNTPPLTINSLTAEERRDLVWRSKKLHKVFGETLAEGAAGRILVGDRSPQGVNRSLEAEMEKGRRSSSVQQLDRLQQKESSKLKVETKPKPVLNHRRSSYPPPSPSPFSSFAEDYTIPLDMLSPTSTSHFGTSSIPMTRAISTPTPKSPLLYSFASPPSPDSDHLASPSIPNSSAFSALGGTKLQQKEERRKKLDKLQRLLGERVPAHLALNDSPGRGMSITELNLANNNSNTSPSKGVGRLLKGAIMGINNRSSSGNWAESYNNSRKVAAEEEILIINLPKGSDGSDANSAISPSERGNEGDQSVLGMAKARKLEQVFGDLPPSSLFLSRSGSVQMDTGPLLSPNLDSSDRRPSQFYRSIDSYRNSIASLSYLIERDPDSLNDITEVYAGRREEDRPISKTGGLGGEKVGFGEYRPVIPPKSDRRVLRSEDTSGRMGSPSSEDGEETATGTTSKSQKRISSRVSTLSLAETLDSTVSSGGAGVSRASSLSRQRTAKKAQKLASFFGTTQGQVWENLLHDLEEAIVEEEGIDEEERQEVLGGVSKLRLAGRDRRGAVAVDSV